MSSSEESKAGSVALVTGANRGIGLQFATQLKAAGWTVIAVVRKTSEALDKLSVHKVVTGVDVSNDESVAALTAQLDLEIDLLVNNAGVITWAGYASPVAAYLSRLCAHHAIA